MTREKPNMKKLTLLVTMLSWLFVLGCGSDEIKEIKKIDPLIKPTYAQALKRAKEVSLSSSEYCFLDRGINGVGLLVTSLFLPEDKKHACSLNCVLYSYGAWISRHHIRPWLHIGIWARDDKGMVKRARRLEAWERGDGWFVRDKNEEKRLTSRLFRRLAKLFMQYPKIYQATSVRYFKIRPRFEGKKEIKDFDEKTDYYDNFYGRAREDHEDKWNLWTLEFQLDKHRTFRVLAANKPRDGSWHDVEEGWDYGSFHKIGFDDLEFGAVLFPSDLYALFYPYDKKKGFVLRPLKEYEELKNFFDYVGRKKEEIEVWLDKCRKHGRSCYESVFGTPLEKPCYWVARATERYMNIWAPKNCWHNGTYKNAWWKSKFWTPERRQKCLKMKKERIESEKRWKEEERKRIEKRRKKIREYIRKRKEQEGPIESFSRAMKKVFSW